LNLAGIYPPLTTPFVDGRLAADLLAANIARYQRHRLAGYLVLGSTGEAALLDDGERLAVLRAARAAIPGDRTMIAGVGLESTAATIRLASAAAECGADALLVVTPSYFRAQMSEEALVRHYTAVADAARRPVLLYNVPQFTGVTIPPAAVARLAQHPNIAGLKDSSGDLAWLAAVLAAVPPMFRVLCGNASVIHAALAAGAVGGILALADVAPEPCVALFELQRAGRTEAAIALQQRLLAAADLIVGRLGVAGVKTGMDERGLAGGPVRAPLLPLGPGERAAVRECLTALAAQGDIAAIAL
jgi:4-hydroxy-2-oxoglutarate aldolase